MAGVLEKQFAIARPYPREVLLTFLARMIA
jgi:hypothetical protein